MRILLSFRKAWEQYEQREEEMKWSLHVDPLTTLAGTLIIRLDCKSR